MSYSEQHTSQNSPEKIEIPNYLEGNNLKKIVIPSFLTMGIAKSPQMKSPYNLLAYQEESLSTINAMPYACGTTCEVSFQQCRECTTCQGCEDNCQHGSCESACMSYCEVNGECNSCLRVCQTVCQEVYQCSCESGECGSCESSSQCGSCEWVGQGCQHNSTEWTAWEVDSVAPTRCRRKLVCKSCGITLKTESGEHTFQGTGSYRFKDGTYHEEVGACSKCGFGLVRVESHSFVNGVCSKCGAVQGSGGVGLPPSITNFTAIPNPNGMSIDCNVSAKNATQFKFGLYDDSPNHIEISSSGMTTSTSWSFPTVPNTYYLVVCEAYNKTGTRTSTSTNVKTPAQKPAKFIWKVTPQTNREFKLCITSSEWERLQTTINAWRIYYNQTPYKFIQIPSADDTFTVARTGNDFTYIYYNQIISGISTIPQFKGSIPSKKGSNPDIWMASDFIAFQNAVNYFLTI